tara:strand:+ start:62 stop:382 length:321 start_codon:yes stop_codon:yes gene_type:complete
MNNKTYNGWYNWETWCVNLWMDNDQGSHEMWREVARESIDADEGTNWFYFEDRLKDYLDYLQEDLHNGVASGLVHDLLGGAISEVNTREIAMHWVADELENMEVTE